MRERLRRAGLVAVPVCLAVFLLAVPWACSAPPEVSGGAVLLLHEVDPEPGGNPDVISPGELGRLLDLLGREGCRVVNPGEFLAWLEGRGVLPPRAVALAFDDGYRGVYCYGYPVLRGRGVAAFLFPVAKWYSRYPRPEPARPHLTAADTLELLRAGWVVGGHGYDGHRLVDGRSWLVQPLPGESLGEYRARVWADLELMKLELGRLGVEPLEFAPPYGELSPELEALVHEAGFRRVWVQEERLSVPGEVRVARLPVSSAEGALEVLGRLFGAR